MLDKQRQQKTVRFRCASSGKLWKTPQQQGTSEKLQDGSQHRLSMPHTYTLTLPAHTLPSPTYLLRKAVELCMWWAQFCRVPQRRVADNCPPCQHLLSAPTTTKLHTRCPAASSLQHSCHRAVEHLL